MAGQLLQFRDGLRHATGRHVLIVRLAIDMNQYQISFSSQEFTDKPLARPEARLARTVVHRVLHEDDVAARVDEVLLCAHHSAQAARAADRRVLADDFQAGMLPLEPAHDVVGPVALVVRLRDGAADEAQNHASRLQRFP